MSFGLIAWTLEGPIIMGIVDMAVAFGYLPYTLYPIPYTYTYTLYPRTIRHVGNILPLCTLTKSYGS
jgi:hypothetical protein